MVPGFGHSVPCRVCQPDRMRVWGPWKVSLGRSGAGCLVPRAFSTVTVGPCVFVQPPGCSAGPSPVGSLGKVLCDGILPVPSVLSCRRRRCVNPGQGEPFPGQGDPTPNFVWPPLGPSDQEWLRGTVTKSLVDKKSHFTMECTLSLIFLSSLCLRGQQRGERSVGPVVLDDAGYGVNREPSLKMIPSICQEP